MLDCDVGPLFRSMRRWLCFTVGDGHAYRNVLTCNDVDRAKHSSCTEILKMSMLRTLAWTTVDVLHTTVTTVLYLQTAIQLLTADTHGFPAKSHVSNH
jgi:hypothetical protein